MTLTHYIVVRRDLPFGVTCAMVAHAAGESFYAFRGSSILERPESPRGGGTDGGASPSRGANADAEWAAHVAGEEKYLRRGSSEKERPGLTGESQVQVLPTAPLEPHRTIAVILGARSETKLLRLERQLVTAGVPHVAIREPDSPYDNALMAIGLVPDNGVFLAAYVKEFHMLPEPV